MIRGVVSAKEDGGGDPLLQQYVKALLGDPEKDRGVYQNSSPIKYIRRAKAPVLVIQGDNDPRVPKEEAQQVVDLLKKDGKTVAPNKTKPEH